MPSDDIAVSVRGLKKTYRLFGHPGDRVKQFLSFGIKRYHRDFTALQDVSFDIRKGETVGIVGHNGSGKSTLLQLICGILQPTSGTARANGRVCALLELGAGFNPEFTGRENVYFQGALLGFTKAQMDTRIDAIAAFADIGEFIDQPVRTYSSGMFVRLAFAAIIHGDADVLVIDEALAVGDEAFQRKCLDRLADYLGSGGKTLLFVSHNLRQLERICDRAIWIDGGRVEADGAATDVCAAYQDCMHRHMRDQLDAGPPRPNVCDSGEITVDGIRLLHDTGGQPIAEIETRDAVRVVVDFHSNTALVMPEIVIGFHTTDLVFIAAASTATLADRTDLAPNAYRIECRFPEVSLLPGVYQLRLAFFDRHRRPMWIGHRLCGFRVVPAVGTNPLHTPLGLVDMPAEWSLPAAATAKS